MVLLYCMYDFVNIHGLLGNCSVSFLFFFLPVMAMALMQTLPRYSRHLRTTIGKLTNFWEHQSESVSLSKHAFMVQKYSARHKERNGYMYYLKSHAQPPFRPPDR